MNPLNFYLGIYGMLFPSAPHENYRDTYRRLQAANLSIKFYDPFSKTKYKPPGARSGKLRSDLGWEVVKRFADVKIKASDVVLDCGLVGLVGSSFLGLRSYYTLAVSSPVDYSSQVKNSSGHVECRIIRDGQRSIFEYDDGTSWLYTGRAEGVAHGAGWRTSRLLAGRVYTTAGGKRGVNWLVGLSKVRPTDKAAPIPPHLVSERGGVVTNSDSIAPKDAGFMSESEGKEEAEPESSWTAMGFPEPGSAESEAFIKAPWTGERSAGAGPSPPAPVENSHPSSPSPPSPPSPKMPAAVGLPSLTSSIYNAVSWVGSTLSKAWGAGWRDGYDAAAEDAYKDLTADEALALYLSQAGRSQPALASVSSFFGMTPRQNTAEDPDQIRDLWSVICRQFGKWPVTADVYAAKLSLISKGQKVDYNNLCAFVGNRWGNLSDLCETNVAITEEDFNPVWRLASKEASMYARNYPFLDWRLLASVGTLLKLWRLMKAPTFKRLLGRLAGCFKLFHAACRLSRAGNHAAAASVLRSLRPAITAFMPYGMLALAAAASMWVMAFAEEAVKSAAERFGLSKSTTACIMGSLDVAARVGEGYSYPSAYALAGHFVWQTTVHKWFMSQPTVGARTARHWGYNVFLAPLIGALLVAAGCIMPPKAPSTTPSVEVAASVLGDGPLAKVLAFANVCVHAIGWAVRDAAPAPSDDSTPEVASGDFEARAAILTQEGRVRQGKRTWVSVERYMAAPEANVFVASVCTRNCELPEVAPGNSVVTTGEMPRCRVEESRGYQCLFPITNRLAVYSFASCYCNLLNCFCNRMAGVPARYKDAHEAGEYFAERSKVRERWRRFRAVHDVQRKVYRGLVVRRCAVRLDTDEWLKRYPAGQRLRIRDKWMTRAKVRRIFKAMVKFEKNVARDPQNTKVDFDGLMANDSSKHVRGISIPEDEARASVGPACHYGSKRWAEVRSGRILYAVGTVEWQRAEWFHAALTSPELFAAYAGDNILLVCGPISARVCACVDIKRMDMHVDPEAGGDASIRWLRRLGEADAVSHFLRTQDPQYRIFSGSSVLSAKIMGTQPSGAGNTTLNNSLQVDELVHAIEEALSLGEEGGLGSLEALVRRVASEFGFNITYDQPPVNKRLNVEFLQQRFYLAIINGATTRAPGNRIGRILGRTFWTCMALNEKKKLGFLRGIALGLRVVNNHVPVINDLMNRILELTEGHRPYYDEDAIKRRRWQEEADFKPFPYEEHPESVAEIADCIGRPASELVALRQHLRNIPLYGFLNPKELEPLVESLLDWDL